MERLVGRRRCGRAGKLRWHGQTPGESSSVEFTSEDENGKRKSGKVEKIRWTARCAPLMRMRSGGTFVFYPRHVDTDPQRDGRPQLANAHLSTVSFDYSPAFPSQNLFTPLHSSLSFSFLRFIHLICANNRLTNKNLSPRINLLGCYIFPTRENYLYLISSD